VFAAVKQRTSLLSFISFFLILSKIESDRDAHKYIVSVLALRSF
jgi:hypothetical protein